MNIARLKNFTEIVKNNFNISATAEKLYTSQPTLSKQMKMLEEELGLALFTRKGKNLAGLTPMGEQVMELAREWWPRWSRLVSFPSGISWPPAGAAHRHHPHHGPLQAAGGHYRILPPLPRGEHPAASGSPCPTGADGAKRGCGDGHRHRVHAPVRRAGDRALLSLGRSVVVPHGHPLLDCQPLAMADLARYPLITYVFGFTGRSKMDKAFGRHGLSPRIVLTATDSDIIKHYVRLGMGVGVIATSAFDEGDRESLVCLNIDHLIASSVAHVCLRRHAHLRDYMYDFIHLYAPM